MNFCFHWILRSLLRISVCPILQNSEGYGLHLTLPPPSATLSAGVLQSVNTLPGSSLWLAQPIRMSQTSTHVNGLRCAPMNGGLLEQQNQHNHTLLSQKRQKYLTISKYHTGSGFPHFPDLSAVVIFICKKHHKTSPNRRYFFINI